MKNKTNYEYLLADLSSLKGVGTKTTNLLKRKKINNIFDLLWKLPKSFTDRTLSTKIDNLKIGENQTVTIVPKKYSFPRIRNLPNRVLCSDETGHLDCIFFNSFEGYIKKILPLNEEIIIHGKANNFRNRFQFVNPSTIKSINSNIIKDDSKYSLSDGLTLSKYNQIINIVLQNLPDLEEWLPEELSLSLIHISEPTRR